MSKTIRRPVKVFCSYSHKDERHFERLRTSLRKLRRQKLIEEWHDRKLLPGEEWEELIDENLKDADVVLLLITPDFVDSDFAYNREMLRAIEKHEQGEAIVIPIIVRPVDWEGEPFAKLQALPKNAKPITTWPNRDEAWLDVSKRVRKAIEGLSRQHAVRPPPTKDLEIRREPDRLPELTPKELEVLRRVQSGQPDSQIAEELSTSIVGVRIHVKRIIRKLGVSNRTQAAARSVELGLVQPPLKEPEKWVLEAVYRRWDNGATNFNENEIEEIGKEAGLDLRDTKRYLKRLLSPSGPIVGGPIDSEERALIGMWVEDVYL